MYTFWACDSDYFILPILLAVAVPMRVATGSMVGIADRLGDARRAPLTRCPRAGNSGARKTAVRYTCSGCRERCLDLLYDGIPVLGNAWIGDLDLPELNDTIRGLTLQDDSPASGSTKGTVASVLRRLFAWAREERIIPVNPAL